MSSYPKPWKVKYDQRCEEWHPKSQPSIVDAKGRLVVALPCTVDHPGLYDELACNTAQEIVRAVNTAHQAAYGFNKVLNMTDKELAS